MVTKFKNHLARTNLARNTINSYVWTIEYFLNHYGEVNKRNLLAYKGYLVENFKPQTVNLRLQGINKYLEFTKQEKLKVWGIERSGFFNGREKWAKGFENQRV